MRVDGVYREKTRGTFRAGQARYRGALSREVFDGTIRRMEVPRLKISGACVKCCPTTSSRGRCRAF